MKKLLIVAFLATFSWGVQAQVKAPAPSPFSKLEQKVGLTDITVEYSRPSMRGRTIFGGLVPYDELWRTGANAYTLVSFSDDVQIGGKAVAAGTYSIFTKPGKQNWEIILYTDTDGGGTPRNWDEGKVAARVMAPVRELPFSVETFTITFGDLNNNSAELVLTWENSYVGVTIDVPTAMKAQKSIDAVLGGPTANDYYAAASYYFEEGKDMKQAKEWIDKAVSMNPEAFWMSRRQSLIYEKLGDMKGAISAAKNSIKAAKARGNDQYVQMNEASLKEWGIE
ncbi:MAG: DUF2911 domain-containing protein [Bacteroidota bacterium]